METLYPHQKNMSEADNINIKRYLSLFLSNWYWFAAALFLSIAYAYGINKYSEKVFSTSATLLIKDDRLGSMSGNAESVIPGGDIFKSQQNLINEIGILKSYSLNYQVMRELEEFHVAYMGVGKREIAKIRLYMTSPFIIRYDSLELEPKEVKVGIKILSEQKFRIELDKDTNFVKEMNFGDRFSEFGFDFIVERRDPESLVYFRDSSNKYYFWFTDPGSLANQYLGKLSVAPIEKEASLVTLSVSGFVPRQEADYLNKLMEVYIDYGLDFKKKIAEQTISFIDEQLEIISDSLEVAAKKLENFRLANNFINLSSEGILIQNRLERTENEKAAFELQLQYYNYLSQYINNKSTEGTIISPSAIGLSDQVLLGLIGDLSSLHREKEMLSLNIGMNQPALELIDRQVEMAREAIRENIRNGIAGLTLSKSETERKISLIEREINRLPSTEKTLITIQRRFDLNNTVYTYLLEKRAESGIARASTLPDNRIIDYAQSKGPVRPKTRNNYLMAFILGLILPMGAMVLIDFFNNKVIDKKDIEDKTKVPVIGYISHSDGKNEIPVIEKPGSSLAESFRSVRTAIKYYIRENESAVIAISSTISSEGKTFISSNLAAITAMLGKKVLLIGLDLRKPRINKVFEFEGSPGMSTYLSGNCKYEEIIMKTRVDNLFYTPSGPIPPNPAELIETAQMKCFMERAKEEFDYIIIDTPPVAIVTDAILLARYVDVNLFIVRQRYTSRNTIEMIEHLNNRGELKNMAIIINDINLSGYYGYGMRYGYSFGYGYSYGYNYYHKSYYGRYGYNNDKPKEYYTED